MTQASFDIRMLGDKKLAKAFKQLEMKTQRKFIKRAMREAAFPIRKTARATAPKETGALGKKISIRVGKSRVKGMARINVQTGTRKQMGLPAYNPKGKGHERFYYPAHVELGTQHMAARPYLRQALEKNRAASMRILAKSLWRLMEGETFRLGNVAKEIM